MRLSLSVQHPADHAEDVVVDADPDTPVSALRHALSGTGDAGPGHLWVAGRLVDGTCRLADSPLRDGAAVSLAPTRAGGPLRGRRWWLLVVGGPCSGTVFDLRDGDWILGRGGDLRVDDPSVSRRHLRVRVAGDEVSVEDTGSRNGTLLDGERLRGSVELRPDQIVQTGDTLLALAPARRADAALEPAGDGTVAFNRPPRLLPATRDVAVQLPSEPGAEHRRAFPLITIIAPAVMGVVMAVVLSNPMYLLFATMSPLIAVASTVSDRRAGRVSHRRQHEEYERELREQRARLEEARLEERAARRAEHPDPARTALTAELPDRRLWERRLHDEDALVVRVGSADLRARVQVTRAGGGRGEDVPEVLVEDVPVTVPLREVGVMGVAGPPQVVRASGRWIVGQLAVRHSPVDVTVVVLTERGTAADWSWLRWLPHARPGDPQGPVARVGNDKETVAARVAELLALVKHRLAEAGSTPLDASAFGAVVVVLDGARTLRTVPGMAQVLRDGPRVGVVAVCLDEHERLLPGECQAVVAFDPEEPALVRVARSGGDAVKGVVADQVSAAWAERLARALSPLRDVSGEERESRLPTSARLLEVLGLEEPTGEAVAARWALSGRSTRAVIGVDDRGPFALDLGDNAHGPHGLVAGTTGSGKSELLQTIVASLAVANRPDAMTFVLVDYKGGSAFKDCVHLPHTVGMVTDLDTTLVERALTSLKAELQRREHLLAGAGAKDLKDYVDLRARNPLPALPRLLLVIDEFASLARELPDFVAGLVSIAERGRSLGIHLLLATQRPSGVVSAAIRANTNLCIALRVTDDSESSDVISAVDAARIPRSTPGRAYARLGHSSLVAFQAGRVGGRRPGAVATSVRPPFVAPLDWNGLGYAAPEPPPVTARDDVEVTDLSVLVSAVQEAARVARVPRQPSPWLPALPKLLTVAELPAAGEAAGDLAPVPYGVEDLPAEQVQRAVVFDPARDGHLFAIGAPRSGRSQLLRTLAASIARSHSTADVHLYGIDCGNGALLPLVNLPHVGAVVQRTQGERATRLLTRLKAEAERRQEVLSTGGFADITEQRRASSAESRLPHLVVLLDRWEGFLPTLGELDNGQLLDVVLALLREGASVGVHVVITGDRSLLSGRVATLTDDKLAFRMADRGDYSVLGLNARKLPEDVPPGRAYRAESGVETQIALLAPDATGAGQATAIAAIAQDATARDAGVPRSQRPFRVDVLPSTVTFEEAWAQRDGETGPLFGLVGVGGDDLRALGPDLSRSAPAFVVAGPARSGRSTLLLSMTRSFLRGGALVVVVAPRPSPLRDLAGVEGVLDVLTTADLNTQVLEDLLTMAGGKPFALVMDDAELLKNCDAADLLRDLVKGATGPDRAVVLGGSADEMCSGFSGWQVEAKRARQGALLSPQGLGDGDLIGVRLSRDAVGGPVQPGRALLHLGDGQASIVTAPTR
ncbi:FtsK/SpoIIIE domain-containing protein [Kineococcus sp. NUM-3379]